MIRIHLENKLSSFGWFWFVMKYKDYMKQFGLVSVIIPVFNVQPYLRENLDSVINQTYENLEIIIVDDGSTDGSSKICDEYAEKDKRVRLIHQENKGLSAARNVGLDIMAGETVTFLDSDDKYHLDFISSMLHAMQKNNSDIVMCKYSVHRTEREMKLNGSEEAFPRIEQGFYDRVSSLRARADGGINSNVWNKLFRSELWKNVRFPVGHVYECVAVSYQVLDRCNRLYVLDELLYLHRIRSGSIISARSATSRYDYVLALAEAETFIKERNPSVFDGEQLIKVRRLKLKQMIIYFFLCGGENKETDLEILKKQIIEWHDEVGISSIRYKIAYYLIRYCPWLLRIAYPMYNRIRTIQRKVKDTFGK